MMTGDEVGVEMGLDEVFDLQVVLLCELYIEVDVALGVDDGGDAVGGDEVGGVGEAAEEELFDSQGFHLFVPGVVYWKGGNDAVDFCFVG